MVSLLLKTIGIWLIIVILAILNGAIREKLLTPNIGSSIALPMSGLLLSILILLVAFVTMPSFFGSSERKTYIFIGAIWFLLTLSFEFLFGHFVAGKSWHEIIQVFNIKKGDLFIVVVFATLISPWLSAKLRGLI
jgi:hypothetical protein